MPGEWFEKGLKARREVVGPEYVERAFKESEAFGLPMEELVPGYVWGWLWIRPGLERKTRSMLNLGFLEGALHVFGADHFSPRLESLLEPFAGHLRLLSVLAKRG